MRKILILAFFAGFYIAATAQTDTSFLKRKPRDTSAQLNMDAIYNRPFLQIGKTPVAIGGYVEANSLYEGTDGVTEGLSFQIPRLTLFISSSIVSRVKFLTEIELEEGGREINIEFASVDVQFNPLLNFRGGVVMNPIGAFNQNHDGPKWEFINRPLSATTIIPSTWSNVGMGLYGKYSQSKWIYAYEAYLTNGFDDAIIQNSENRTWLPASKLNRDRFEESNNGVPLVTTKFAVRRRNIGELGISWMGGVYNKFRDEGLTLDKRRRVDVFAIDFNTILPTDTYFIGEYAWAAIDVPSTFTQQFGNRQQGGFLDIVQPILKRRMLNWERSTLNLALRLEYVDYNVGTFRETGGNIYDNITSVTPGISLRPTQQTVFRANYRYSWNRDILGNPASKTAAILVGFSTYF